MVKLYAVAVAMEDESILIVFGLQVAEAHKITFKPCISLGPGMEGKKYLSRYLLTQWIDVHGSHEQGCLGCFRTPSIGPRVIQIEKQHA